MVKFSNIGLVKAAFLLGASLLLPACSDRDAQQPKFATVDITGALWAKDFRLTDHTGHVKSLADFKGKAVVLFFGYVNCPDVCPTTLAKLAVVLNTLGADATRVQVLLVTLDPKRDTPEILRQYVPAFHPAFVGLYGDEKATDAIAKEFKVFYQRQKPAANGFYTVDHGGGIFVFDPYSRIRLFISDEHGPDVIAGDLQTLLKQADGKLRE